MEKTAPDPKPENTDLTPEPGKSRYDRLFYDSIFGAGEGPPDLAARSKEIFAEIMDEKHKPRSK